MTDQPSKHPSANLDDDYARSVASYARMHAQLVREQEARDAVSVPYFVIGLVLLAIAGVLAYLQ